MTIDDFADYSRANGTKVEKVNGLWWTQARPFFFRPLLPFAEVDPGFNRYPSRAFVGGVLHAVSSLPSANSLLNLLVYDDLQNYSFDGLGKNQRRLVKKGMSCFEAKRITGIGDFVGNAYGVYLSFYNRTKYRYKNERIVRNHFNSWAKALFDNPKVLIIGAYCQGKLSAVDISLLVEDVIYDDFFFSDTESQLFKVTDFILHTKRELAASTDAKYIFRGLPTGKRSLDESKIVIRGCKILQLPAFCRINPIALYAAKLFMRDSYNKFLGLTAGSDLFAAGLSTGLYRG